MNQFYNCFRTELLKTKRTLSFSGAIIIPTVITGVNFLTFVVYREDFAKAGANLWIALAGNIFSAFALLFLPMYVGMVGYSTNHIEHQADAWKNLFALPLKRSTIYLSKLCMVLLQVITCVTLLYALTLLSGQILGMLYPELGFQNYDSTVLILVTIVKFTLASLGTLAIQYVVSIYWSDFIKPMGAALIGLVVGILLAKWKFAFLVPYSLCPRVMEQFQKENLTVFNREVLSSVLWATGVFILGYWLILRKNVK